MIFTGIGIVTLALGVLFWVPDSIMHYIIYAPGIGFVIDIITGIISHIGYNPEDY
jgi:hypothetical protein